MPFEELPRVADRREGGICRIVRAVEDWAFHGGGGSGGGGGTTSALVWLFEISGDADVVCETIPTFCTFFARLCGRGGGGGTARDILVMAFPIAAMKGRATGSLDVAFF